jgi:hypothetical protein
VSFYRYDEDRDLHALDCGGTVTLELGLARFRLLERELRARPPREGILKLLVDFRETVWADESVHRELSRITRAELLDSRERCVRVAFVDGARSGEVSENERWFHDEGRATDWLADTSQRSDR